MNTALQSRIAQSPDYKKLLERRRRLIKPLLLVGLVPYYSFILVLAFKPGLLSLRMGEGVTTLGIVLGVALIALTIAITGIYIHQTDTKSEVLLEAIKRNTMKG